MACQVLSQTQVWSVVSWLQFDCKLWLRHGWSPAGQDFHEVWRAAAWELPVNQLWRQSSHALTGHCGVTWEPLTVYCPWATAQMRRSKFRCEVGPRLKCWITALKTLGWVLGNPWVWDSISNFQAMFWNSRHPLLQVWSTFVQMPWQSKREAEPQGVTWSAPGGGGMLGNFQQNSRILILSVYSLSNVCNN